MKAIATKTVREVALENPAATRIFEQLGIDYCCGGHKPLEEAVAAKNLSLDDVLARLDAAGSTVAKTGKDWQSESLAELINHINSTHHVYVRSEVPRILALLEKVAGVHGERHPELNEVRERFYELSQELASHLMKEEQILFPYIASAEQAQSGACASPHSCFGTVQNPIRMMMFEHDNAGGVLRELRQLTNDYTVPADGCITYKTVFEALQAFEADLHQHIHLENNILFPRAIAMEG